MPILEATVEDISTIQQIAKATWPLAYGNILSSEQIEYMLDKMYSKQSILEQITHQKHHFFIYEKENKVVAFASFQFNYPNANVMKLHKLYALPETQGLGIGKELIQFISHLGVEKDQSILQLNVNRFNSAVSFYQKQGFEIVKEENIAIGHGFWMEDYVMEKSL